MTIRELTDIARRINPDDVIGVLCIFIVLFVVLGIG